MLPTIQENLVERTTGVNRPPTCYRCQQGYITSLGNIYHTLYLASNLESRIGKNYKLQIDSPI